MHAQGAKVEEKSAGGLLLSAQSGEKPNFGKV
jgi:co-chaperonin GroES (HSP10)